MARQHPTFKLKPELSKSKLINLKQSKPNNNSFRQIQTKFLHTTSTFERTRTFYSNTVNSKPRDVALFTDIMLKSLRMKEFNRSLNGDIAHLKPFPGSKVKQLDHHAIPSLKEHRHDAAVIRTGIKDLLKNGTNIKVKKLLKILPI